MIGWDGVIRTGPERPIQACVEFGEDAILDRISMDKLKSIMRKPAPATRPRITPERYRELARLRAERRRRWQDEKEAREAAEHESEFVKHLTETLRDLEDRAHRARGRETPLTIEWAMEQRRRRRALEAREEAREA